jgi:hypothetical protein
MSAALLFLGLAMLSGSVARVVHIEATRGGMPPETFIVLCSTSGFGVVLMLIGILLAGAM